MTSTNANRRRNATSPRLLQAPHPAVQATPHRLALRPSQKTFEALVLYHKLCDESTGIETLRAEQDRARSARDEREVTRVQLAIEDV